MNPILNSYEKKQLELLEEWKLAEPTLLTQSIATALSPIKRVSKHLIPESAIRGVLDFSLYSANRLADLEDIVLRAGVTEIAQLQYEDLEICDVLADEFHKEALAYATVEGVGVGLLGLPGIGIDIPAIITLAIRTTLRIAACYGFSLQSVEDRQLLLGIMAISAANNKEEKSVALANVAKMARQRVPETTQQVAEQVVEKKLEGRTSVILLYKLAEQLAVNLTQRKFLQVVPLLGGVLGGTVNASYINDVAWAARRTFQEKCLYDQQKLS
ncbi:MAG: EcsC family protein [Spirochaetota bacterium]